MGDIRMEKNIRIRVLLVMEILLEKTDKDHGVSMQEILEWIAESGVAGERKSVYEDIPALQKYGLNIQYNIDDRTYRLIQRGMDTEDIKLFAKALDNADFVDKDKKAELINDIASYASCYEREEIIKEFNKLYIWVN